MNLLLDTHVILWAAYEPDRLSTTARDLLLSEENALLFSVASLWEMTIKRALDRPDFRVDAAVLRSGLLSNGYQEVVITGAHCQTLAALPHHHRDPFDRMLVAQAMTDGMQLVTADSKIAQYDGPIVTV